MIVLDTWWNCGPNPNPKLEIRYGNGTSNYTECPTDNEPTYTSLSLLRQPTYNRMKITYDNGNISVYINNVFYLSGYYLTNYTGYLGFTASTGAEDDNESIKNVIIYTSFPKAVAGQNRTICTNDTIVIGTSSQTNYTYSWTPTKGLDNPTKANPSLTLTNNTSSDQTYMYKVTVNSAGIGCKSADSVYITVRHKPIINMVKDTVFCKGDSLTIYAPSGFSSYKWGQSRQSTVDSQLLQ